MRGAWIEIIGQFSRTLANRRSLPMRGAWIEILTSATELVLRSCRSPCGERGLKYTIGNVTFKSCAVAPHAGSVD